jgi:hypothetical protein
LVVNGCKALSFSAGASAADTPTQGATNEQERRMAKPLVEYRIPLTTAEHKAYSDNFKAIEGMEERKQAVLERCRKAKR